MITTHATLAHARRHGRAVRSVCPRQTRNVIWRGVSIQAAGPGRSTSEWLPNEKAYGILSATEGPLLQTTGVVPIVFVHVPLTERGKRELKRLEHPAVSGGPKRGCRF